MPFTSCGNQTKSYPKIGQSSIFVHRFVWFFQCGWNAFNLSLPIHLFFTHESFYFGFYLFPIFHLRHSLCVEGSRLFLNKCCLPCMLAPSREIWIMISFALRMFIAFRPHLMMMFCLNSPLLAIPIVTLDKCKAWTRNMMAMHSARLRWLTSRMISTLLFEEFTTWAICNAEMMAIICFSKQM